MVLGKIINETQSAFIQGRLITDNYLVSYECHHWMRNRKKGKKGYVAMKMDMSKAYDRVEWAYLDAVMMRFGFPENFRNLIMRCVSTVRSSMILNGVICGSIRSERGLRQGDPLSPLLFVMCAEGFSSLIRKAPREKRIKGVPLVPKKINITHLLLANDSILFYEGTAAYARQLREILWTYEKASGKVINFEKSCVSFSPNMRRKEINEIMEIMGMNEGREIQVYLGLPTLVLRQKRIHFSYIRERVMKRIMEWNSYRDFSVAEK